MYENDLASFVYDGKKIVLSADTINSENTYELQCDHNLRAILEYRKVEESAFYCLLRLKNTGKSNTLQITQPKSFDITVDKSGYPLKYHSLNGDSCGAQSFLPIDCTITSAQHVEPFGGRSSNTTGFPFFDLSFGDKSIIFAIGWTGQWSEDIFVAENQFNVQIGLCNADFYLKPGEEVRLPSVLVMTGANPQKLRRDFKNLIRKSFSPRTRLKDKMKFPVSIQPFDRYFQGVSASNTDDTWATENGQIRTIFAADKCKYFNSLWLDAAWFEKGFPHGVGNYRFSEGFPKGLKKVSDTAHEHDMQFILWFEPERVYEGSDLYHDHQEMLLSKKDNHDTRLFNLADVNARNWLIDTLVTFIKDNGIDVYRQDFNMDPLQYWLEADEASRIGITEMKYVEGLYVLWDTLVKSFPDLLIDNCASGGRRIDLETVSRAVHLWRSDTGCYPEDEKMRVTAWNHNQILTLCEYVPFNACAIWEPDAYTVRSTQTEGLACNFDIFNNDFDFEQAKNVLGEAVENTHNWEGDFYPLTKPSVMETVWSAYQLALCDSGICYIFRREKSELDNQIFKLNAICENELYELTFIDEYFNRILKKCSGRELMSGIELSIPNPRNSLLVRYKKCNETEPTDF